MNILHKFEDIEDRKIFFFDLDGTLINTSTGKTFPEDVTDFRINKKVLDVLRRINSMEYLFIVSNQAVSLNIRPKKISRQSLAASSNSSRLTSMSEEVLLRKSKLEGITVLPKDSIQRIANPTQVCLKDASRVWIIRKKVW